MKSKLSGIPETMLIPLWAKACETERNQPIIKDPKALQIISQIDYDFSVFKGTWLSQTGVSIRTMLLDNAAKSFFDKNEKCVVINLGAGLDTRFDRLGNKNIRWYDIDVEEGISIRKNFFTEQENLKFIPKSIFDLTWADEVETGGLPVLIIAEGLFMYFSQDELKPFFHKLIDAFPRAEILFEMLAPMLVGKSGKHDTVKKMEDVPEFKWGLKKSRDMEAWDTRIRFVEEWDYYDFHKDRWKWFGYIGRFFLVRPRLSNRIVHLCFSD